MAHDVLSGDLDRVSLASVLQLLEMEGHQGTLVLAEGELGFVGGSLVSARFLGLEGANAAVEALVRARGWFSVHDGGEELEGQAVSIQSLVLESCRLLDEIHRVGGMAPLRPTAVPAGLETVLGKADGLTPLVELIAAAEAHVTAIIDPVCDAMYAGTLKGKPTSEADPVRRLEVRADRPVVTGPEPTSPEVPLAAFDDLVFDARRYVRERRFDDAIAALQGALRQRPDSRIAQQNLNRVLKLRESEA